MIARWSSYMRSACNNHFMSLHWTIADLHHFLTAREETRVTLGLSRIIDACARLQHPERAHRCVHIAGTNGKGSTLAFLRTLLMDAGLRVGCYTSPHLIDVTERFTINDAHADPHALAALAGEIFPALADIPLTYFETLTLLAFAWFARANVDVVLYEVGLGGRLDATNVITPELIALTPIALDHQHYLGDTLAAIAREKCGVMKTRVPVISAPQTAEVLTIMRDTCTTQHASLEIVAPLADAIPLGLAGTHQRVNAALAVACARQLLGARWRDDCCQSLANARWPGRCEWISQSPRILFDGAHNPHGIAALAEYLRTLAPPPTRIHAIFGALADKPAEIMIDGLRPLIDQWYVHVPPSPRAQDAHSLVAHLVARGTTTLIVRESVEMIRIMRAAPADVVWVITGSLHLYPFAQTLALTSREASLM